VAQAPVEAQAVARAAAEDPAAVPQAEGLVPAAPAVVAPVAAAPAEAAEGPVEGPPVAAAAVPRAAPVLTATTRPDN
jgi:hypothetical protein